MSEDTTLHTPGEDPPPSDPPIDDKDARIAALEQENAGLQAMVGALQDKADAASETEEPPPSIRTPRLIGEDWGNKTAAQAKAAGVQHTVLCIDGYYVPGA